MEAAWKEWLEIGYTCFKKSGYHKSQADFSLVADVMYDKPAPPLAKDGLTVYERRLQRLSQDLGHHLSVSELQYTASTTLASWNRYLSLDEDSLDVLEKLKVRYQLALISNFDHPPFIHSSLRQHKLKPYFYPHVIISGEVGIEKPDARIFAFALQSTGLSGSEAIYVGDSPQHDTKGAQNAGMVPVLIQRDPQCSQPSTESNGKANQSLNIKENTAPPDVKTIRRLTELLDIF